MSGAAATTQAQKIHATRGQPLQIELDSLPGSRLAREVVKTIGICPQDEPAWPGYTASSVDRRYMHANTARYVSATGQKMPASHRGIDDIAVVIRKQVRQVLATQSMPLELPTILFEYDSPGSQGASIDLVFKSSAAAIAVLNNIPNISVKQAGQQDTIYKCRAWSNSLPRDVLPIDCLGLLVEDANSKLMLKSLDRAVGEVGSVVGVGRMKLAKPIEGLADGDELRPRAYLKLSRASMTVPFSQLYTSLPTHFVWYGTPYRLYYPGSGLRNDVQYSADYPLEEDEATTSSDNSHSGSKTASPGSNSSTAIEVKEEKEEGGSCKRSRKE